MGHTVAVRFTPPIDPRHVWEAATEMITLKLDSATGHRSVTVAGNTYTLRPHYSTDGRRRGYMIALKTPNAAERDWKHAADLMVARREITEHAGLDLEGEDRNSNWTEVTR